MKKTPEYLLHPYFEWWTENEKTISMYLGLLVVGLLLGVVIGVFILK